VTKILIALLVNIHHRTDNARIGDKQDEDMIECGYDDLEW